MYLKSIDIYGFKSFPQRVSLAFEPGITAIVGPNGCGKSNVFDAIVWSLGEQSPKSLRGSKMEDIIFNGTATHPPLNYAEVTMVFSNEDRALNIDFEEVSITRKLFRSGESEYYINKSPARLKDIQDMLHSVGLGQGSYSFILQGKINSFIMAKPEEKRVIFDEAAGILKYKEKKRETARKLEDTENNLLRVEDIIQEVSRQINSLERQVKKAKRYQEIHEELIDTERKITILKIRELNLQQENLSKGITQIQERENLLQQQISQHQQSLKDIETKAIGKAKEKEFLQSQIISLEADISRFQNNIQINQQRIEEFSQRENQLRQNQQEQKASRQSQKERIARLEQVIEKIGETILQNEERIKACGSEITALEQTIIQKKNIIKQAKEALLGIEEERVSISNQIIDIQSKINTLSARKKRLELERLKVSGEISTYKKRQEEITSEKNSLINNLNLYTSQLKDVQDNIRNTESKIEKDKTEIAETEKNIEILSSQLELLKDLKTKYEQFPQAEEIEISINKELPLQTVLIGKIEQPAGIFENQSGKIFKFRMKTKIIPQKSSQIENDINALKEKLLSLNTNLQNGQDTLSQLKQGVEEIESKAKEADKRLATTVESLNNINENTSRLEEEISIIEMDIKEAEEGLNESRRQESGLVQERSAKESLIEEKNSLIRQTAETINNSTNQIKDLQIETAKLSTQIESLKEEKNAKTADIEIFRQDMQKISAYIEQIYREITSAGQKIKEIKEETEKLAASIATSREKLDVVKTNLEEILREEENLSRQKSTINGQISRLAQELEGLKQKEYDLRIRLKDMDFSKTQTQEYFTQTYQIDFDAESVREQKIEETIDELNNKKEELKRKENNLGNVNLVAIDEFEELKQRYDFLNRQKEDVLLSKETLKKAIAKINKLSRELFLETFQKIQEVFKDYFRFLFGGGQAKITLLDESNVLESGIEINVQPPGKKLQNLSLLSGGEKSLTAIALIFAIFKVKPSPLCILDEIDAPLDESNIDRFNHTVKDFTEKSQFIVITHNKKTISIANVLYGVTMQEPGVSKIVSVKLLDSEKTTVS